MLCEILALENFILEKQKGSAANPSSQSPQMTAWAERGKLYVLLHTYRVELSSNGIPLPLISVPRLRLKRADMLRMDAGSRRHR